MPFVRLSQICLSSALWLLAMPLVTAAQTPVGVQTGASARPTLRPTSVGGIASGLVDPGLLTPGPIMPDLPPLRPLLPDPVDLSLRLVLKRSDRRVYLYRGATQIGSYPVAVGKAGWETPLGTWEVNDMQEHPSWVHPFNGEVVPPGPDNPLGERWIGFWTNGRSYIGFHGTPTRESIGRAASHGCVRMYNEDVRALYELVEIGTPVVVVP